MAVEQLAHGLDVALATNEARQWCSDVGRSCRWRRYRGRSGYLRSIERGILGGEDAASSWRRSLPGSTPTSSTSTRRASRNRAGRPPADRSDRGRASTGREALHGAERRRSPRRARGPTHPHVRLLATRRSGPRRRRHAVLPTDSPPRMACGHHRIRRVRRHATRRVLDRSRGSRHRFGPRRVLGDLGPRTVRSDVRRQIRRRRRGGSQGRGFRSTRHQGLDAA